MDSKYKALLDEPMIKATEILNQRNEQYNLSGITPRDYWIFGNLSIIHEIYKKALRLASLSHVEDKAQMEDSLLDIINYCRFLYAELKLEPKEYKWHPGRTVTVRGKI